jgi:hypothetical protein
MTTARVARRSIRLDLASSSADLIDRFLEHQTYRKDFCFELLDLARQPSVSWDTRRLAILMAEHQILKLRPDDLENFDLVLTQLRLKQPGLQRPLTPAVLKEGYSTTELRGFVIEFRRRLARLDRVHRQVRGAKTTAAALQEFTEVSRRDCKLTLGRYLFGPDEIADRILAQLRVSEGVNDVDIDQPHYLNAEIAHAMRLMPDYEARILRRLCEGNRIYWVGEQTTQAINSLVEYPLTTVVLVIKPPGSHFEFELKRAGRRGDNPLSVVYTRGKNRVPASHRLDGGSMQWLLRYEARNGSKLGSIYRLVHGTEAPLPAYISRSNVYAVPTRGNSAPAFRYFTDQRIFGNGNFAPMRAAMKSAVEALKNEEGENLPELPGDLHLTAEFLSHVIPAQAIVSGTSSFRVDKLAIYLAADGAETYFKQYRQVDYNQHDAKQFADELLEEVLGVYEAPAGEYKSYGEYLAAALSVAANRQRADQVFLALVKEIAVLWGTMLGARGHSRGESFVARNVGVRSVWEQGKWRVKLVFMDHDGLSLPEMDHGHFYADTALRGMLLDERHTWGGANPDLYSGTLVGSLERIYQIDAAFAEQARTLAEVELKAAYQKTLQAMLTNATLRAFFSQTFLRRLSDWDQFASGYLAGRPRGWKTKMKKLFAEKGYEADAFDYYLNAVEHNKGFLERNACLFAQ